MAYRSLRRGSGRLGHPPRYAALLRPPSPKIPHSSVHWLGQAACLSYLATDHLQIFFGMAGMETQIATALGLCAVFQCVAGSLWAFGLLAGLAVLARPDMVVLDAVCFVGAAVRWRWAVWKPAALAVAVVAPWLAFATAYYGSPIPLTIRAKAAVTGTPDLSAILGFAADFWKQLAPFWEFVFVQTIPVPNAVPALVVIAGAGCALVGLAGARRGDALPLLLIAAIVALYGAYLVRYTVNPYYMWYRPPFLALYFVLVATGVSRIATISTVASGALALGLAAGYAVPIPYVFPLDREMQRDVDDAVRTQVGRKLAGLMQAGDSVYMEPLGYIGIQIPDKMIYDYPGLGSKVAFRTFEREGWGGALSALKPTFLVFRPDEADLVRDALPDLMEHYREVAHVVGPTGRQIGFAGLTYGVADSEFYIFRRIEGESR